MEEQILPEIVLEKGKIQKEYIKDLFRFRELFFFFAWRDILVRYKQAFFGVTWALVRPLLNMVAFAFLFGKIAKLPSDSISYPLFVLAGMLPWQLLSNTILDTTICLLNNPQLITKLYFPRMIIPLSLIIVHIIDFIVSFALFLFLIPFLGGVDFYTFPLVFFFIFQTLCLCAGFALWLSSLTVLFRDVRFLIPFFVQFGLFISPVGYGTFVIPEKWIYFYGLNPIVGIIDGFRYSFFGISHPYFTYTLFSSLFTTVFLLVSGFYFFRKTEKTFADTI